MQVQPQARSWVALGRGGERRQRDQVRRRERLGLQRQKSGAQSGAATEQPRDPEQVELPLSTGSLPGGTRSVFSPLQSCEGMTHACSAPPAPFLRGSLLEPVPRPEQLETWVQGGPPASVPVGTLGDLSSVTVQDPRPTFRRSARNDFREGLGVRDSEPNSGAGGKEPGVQELDDTARFLRVSILCPSLRALHPAAM